MVERLHTPPHFNPIPIDAPLMFLAGPIQGSPDWQTPTALLIGRHFEGTHVATPRRQTDVGFDYNEQVAWEKAHLRRSRELGVIMFWFAAQDHTLSYEAGRAYAQTSRIELGRAIGWHDTNPFPLVIGFDPAYSANGGGNERYIRTLAEEANLRVHDDLDDVIDEVMLYAR
jgi:hypothetical protein